jgi:FMN-dependent oxidoreductase (nitrilotriacetate monooxygenase family)
VKAARFHLGWFLANGFGLQSWNGPWSGTGGDDWMMADLYVEMAKALERACFDYMIVEDTLMIHDNYQDSTEIYLKNGFGAPKHDPVALAAILTQATTRIGIVPTISTAFYPPFMAARMMATLDHLSRGRIGCNLVTSSSHRAAQNFGLDKHIEHDLRYEMASEWVDLVTQLWDSWDPDALVRDSESGTFADYNRVRRVDFDGDYYKCRGPLNVAASPQRHPVIVQAGGSSAGREFAAKHADTVISAVQGAEAMGAYRVDLHDRMARYGRKPEECKVLFLVSPILGETDREAEEREGRIRDAVSTNIEWNLAAMSYFSGKDFSQFDLDAPLPALMGVNGHQSTIADFENASKGKTLRQMAAEYSVVESVRLVGSPDTVADQMEDAMEVAGGDGFLIASTVTRRSVSEVADGLVPALQRRGLVRTSYGYDHFRDNLLDF